MTPRGAARSNCSGGALDGSGPLPMAPNPAQKKTRHEDVLHGAVRNGGEA